MKADSRVSIAILLVFQAGLGLLSALGLFAFARLSNATTTLARQEVIAFGVPLLLLLLAVGMPSSSRVVRMGVYAFEGVTLLGTTLSVLLSQGDALTLTVGLSGLALPGAVISMLRGWSPSRRSLTVALLMTTGMIHLWLAPSHVNEPPKLGGLLAIDGVAFIVLGIACARDARWWRGPTVALLLASVAAYLVIVSSGQEAADDLGLATKLVELLALALVLWPETVRARWRALAAATSVSTAILLSGGLAWAASLRSGSAGHTHAHTLDGKVLIAAAAPTEEQRLAAAKLIDDTRSGIQRYADVRAALSDGYVQSTPGETPTAHYTNPKYVADGVVDPTRPQALVYASTPHGQLLLGAMYMMPTRNKKPPDIGGSLAQWHTHSNLCFAVPKFAIDGVVSPFGTCPAGSINAPTPAMLHVWTVPNPAGPFGDLTPAYLARLTRE